MVEELAALRLSRNQRVADHYIEYIHNATEKIHWLGLSSTGTCKLRLLSAQNSHLVSGIPVKLEIHATSPSNFKRPWVLGSGQNFMIYRREAFLDYCPTSERDSIIHRRLAY